MFYRANKDIHSQRHPDDFSISLNLLASPPEQGFKDQYCFDLGAGKIISHVGTTNMTRLMLCKLAKYVGNGSSINLLEAIAKEHISPRIRAQAYDSLAALVSDDDERIWNMALLDESPYIQNKARSIMSLNINKNVAA